jgi:hypothetical protein
MRALRRLFAILLMLPPLAGCGPDSALVSGGLLAGSGAALPIFHRTPVDMVVSTVSGRDCSVVHLDRLEQYCTPKPRPPEPQPFCTRSLGVADCWEDPSKLPNHPREIADGPRALTPDQEANRTRRWPALW